MTRSQDPAVPQVKHASAVYRTHRATMFGPYVWKYPREAWAALFEVFPWEALALSLVATAGMWRFYGPELASSLGSCLALALCVLQLFRTKSFVTSTAIIQQRGLFSLSRRSTSLSDVSRGRVVRLEPSTKVGDVVLETTAGELRLRSLSEPDKVLERLISLRNAMKEGRAQ